MSKLGRNFGSENEDYERLRVHNGDLFWNGKKLRTEGWTRSEKFALAGLLLAILITAPVLVLANLDKIKEGACTIHEFPFCNTSHAKTATSNSQPNP